MWKFSSLVAMASMIRDEHLRTPAGRIRALKALSAPIRSPSTCFRWITFLRNNNLAKKQLAREEHFAVKPLLKYLNLRYTFRDRVRVFISHYEFVTQYFSALDIDLIYGDNGLCLAEFLGKSGTSYRVVLGTYSVCHPEGEMVLRIETSDAKVVCFAVFSIGESFTGKPQIELGCLQGAPRTSNPNVTKLAAKDFHSTFPKHLLMAVLCSFACTLKIQLIDCISDRTSMASYNLACRAQHDSFWKEFGAHELDNSGFYMLSLDHDRPKQVTRKHTRRHKLRAKQKETIYKMIRARLKTTLLPLCWIAYFVKHAEQVLLVFDYGA
jgi:uncharacterized protein VirK/YbjX